MEFFRFLRARWVSFLVAFIVALSLGTANLLFSIFMSYDEELVDSIPFIVSGASLAEVSEYFNMMQQASLVICIVLTGMQMLGWVTFFIFQGSTAREDLYLLRLKTGLGRFAISGAMVLLISGVALSGISFALAYGLHVLIDRSYMGQGFDITYPTGITWALVAVQALAIPLLFLALMILPLSTRRGLIRAIKEIND